VEQVIPDPFAILVSLHGVAGRELTDSQEPKPPWDQPKKFDRVTIELPDVVLRTEDVDKLELSLKPVFDGLWQAAGWPRSKGYGADGSFLAARHPNN
jgi:hypothetical protein